jgi:hypothetical protein
MERAEGFGEMKAFFLHARFDYIQVQDEMNQALRLTPE